MKRVILLVVCLVLLSVLSTLAAAEQVCITGNGVSTACFYEDDCSACTNAEEFEAFCDARGGSVTSDPGDQCITGCCCDGTVASPSAPVSRAYCVGQGDTFLPGQSSCVQACRTGGTGGTTFAVSGRVLNDESPRKPVGGAMIQYPEQSGPGLFITTTDTQGRYEFLTVAAGTYDFIASASGCEESIRQVTVTAATVVDFNLTCSGSCEPAAPTKINATPVSGEAKVTVQWNATSCSLSSGSRVYRCRAGATGTACAQDPELIGQVPYGEKTFTDTDAPTGQRLCYLVATLDENGVELPLGVTAAGQCIEAMDEYCVTHTHNPRCFNNDASVSPKLNNHVLNPFTGVGHCDPKNRLFADLDCAASNTICIYNIYGSPVCDEMDACDKCNGIFGFFVNPLAVVSNARCNQMPSCFLNNRWFATDTYQSCGTVKGCQDYRTPAACTATSSSGDYDRCLVAQGGCTWHPVDGLESIGKGVCLATQPTTGACNDCNAVFGTCNQELCAMLGACYYSDPDCLSFDQLSCAKYASENDCTGGTAVSVSALYDSEDVRINGTHAFLVRSNDLLDLGTCFWSEEGENANCVKDANNWRKHALGTGVVLDDCREVSGKTESEILNCQKDNQAPVTQLPFGEGAYIDAMVLRNMKPIIHDNLYSSNVVTTAYCLVPLGQSCYPSGPLAGLPTVLGAQQYSLFYYSEDPARNLEEVQNRTLIIYQDSNARLIAASVVPGAN